MYSGVPQTRPGRVSAPPAPDGGAARLEDLREAEVDDLHEVEARAQRLEHDVVGLEVAVHDAERVRLFERGERLPQHVDDARARGSGPSSSATRPRSRPRRYSMTMYGWPSLGAAEVEDGDASWGGSGGSPRAPR